jgi:anthranilate synthase/aminodeoxychorismate synthase-like glutamine amidotransferase
MILIIDHKDSFTFNIADAYYRLNQEVEVYPSEKLLDSPINLDQFSHLILSPGPGRPFESIHRMSSHPTWNLLSVWPKNKPILGICLGHQMLAVWKGGEVIKAQEPIHGKVSLIHHESDGIFSQIPNPMEAGRYHSLVVDQESLPKCFTINAWTNDNIIMGIKHESLPIQGLQFHPDSILTPDGLHLFKNFLDQI